MYAVLRMRLFTVLILPVMTVVLMLAHAPVAKADTSFCYTVTDVPRGECLDLVELYLSTGGANWINKTNWLTSTQLCTWHGVVCGTNTVTALDLNTNNLVGAFPSAFGTRLPNLGVLRLHTNQLTGAIPSTVTTTALYELDLNYNQFSSLSDLTAACDTLLELHLSDNPLGGTFPTWINEECTLLEQLNMWNTGLTGDFPDLSGLGDLSAIYLGNNNFTPGTSYGGLLDNPLLTVISLAQTNRTGTFPVFNAPLLQTLDLSANHFSDRTLLPSYFSPYNNNLRYLILRDLQLETLDPTLATSFANTLWHLDVEYNALDQSLFTSQTTSAFQSMITNQVLVHGANWWKWQYLPPQVIPTNINTSSIRIDLEPSVLFQEGLNRPGDKYEILQSPNPIGGPYSRVTVLDPAYFTTTPTVFYLMYNSFIPGETYHYSARMINDSPNRPTPKLGAIAYNESVDVAEFPPVECWDTDATGVPESDCVALMHLYESTGGPNWGQYDQAGWGEAANVCLGGWQNVRCDDGRVSYLFMGDVGMTGDFPHVITELTGLVGFFFDRNQLTGTLPDFTGMPNLYYIIAPRNFITGGLPQLPPSVGYINLAHNQLTGSLPFEYTAQDFDGIVLNGNMLSGDLPTGFGTNPNFGVGGVFGHVNLSYNALTVSDSATITALTAKNPSFFTTQTLPPTGITATAGPNYSVMVSWTLPTYTADGGFYEVGLSQAGGPYIFMPATRTPDKLTTSTTVFGLSPNIQYCFVVLTGTNPHGIRPPSNDFMTDTSTHNYNMVLSAASAQSSCLTLPENTQPPTTTQTLSPMPDSILTGTRSPSFTWNSHTQSEQITTYRLRIRNDQTGEVVLNRRLTPANICADGTCSVSLSTLRTPVGLPNGKYNWQVSAINAYGTTTTPKQLFTLTKPSAATLSAPINDLIVATATPTLEFFIPDGEAITSVRVVVRKVGSITPRVDSVYPVSEVCSGTFCAVTVPKTLKAGRYEWRVQVKNSNGKRQSEMGRFKISF